MKNYYLLCFVLVTSICNASWATDYFVNTTRPDDSGNGLSLATAKKTIQAAVNAASANDVVIVSSGSYNENVNITKSLTITGAGKLSSSVSNTVLSPSSACGGVGITIAASNVTISSMYLIGYETGILLNGVTNPKLNDLTIVDYCLYGVSLSGSNQNIEIKQSNIQRTTVLAGTVGIRAGIESEVNGLLIDGCTINGNIQGMLVQASTLLTFDNITIQKSTISNNTQKGLYFEKLSNALLSNLTMDNNGTDATYGFNNGIDINLKYGSYNNITIQNCDITNSGFTGSATNPLNPAAIAIKARDDSPSYNTIPASLNGVILQNNKITSPTNGIRFGEFDKTNASPTNITLQNNDLGHPFTGKAIISRINGTIDMKCNWHGSTNVTTIQSTFTTAGSGLINLIVYLTNGTDNDAAIGFQPSPSSCTGCPGGGLITNTWTSFNLTLINIGSSQSGKKPGSNVAKSAWSGQFITADEGPVSGQSTQNNPAIFHSENLNKIAPRYWTIAAESCLGTTGSLSFEMRVVPEVGAVSTYNTHENNSPYLMYANRDGFTELYAQNHPYFGFFASDGSGGNAFDAGLPKGLYRLKMSYWSQKGGVGLTPTTRQPIGNVLASEEFWFRIQSKDGVGKGAVRVAADLDPSHRRTAGMTKGFAEVMPNPVAREMRLQVNDVKGQEVSAMLMDASGRTVLQRSFMADTHTHQEEFGVGELANGMYFLKVNTANKNATLKVVKVE